MTSVSEFYAGRSVFVTGATGFVGKVLIEKLLRSCPAIKTVYVLVRPKKGQDPNVRIQEMVSGKLFERVRHEQPDFAKKVVAIAGDMLEPQLGISQEDHTTLVSEVSIIFHSAATVKFDEVLKLSMQMNVIGLRKMLDLARKMPTLEAFVHVSTAYANCDRKHVAEAVYPPKLHPQKLVDAIDWMEDEVIDTLTPKLIRPRPNTYTFTKSLAEWLFLEEKGKVPCAIVRPSIVGASWLEPFPGWVDNFNGPAGLFAAIGKGIMRTMHGKSDGTADIIPVDVVTNLMIAVAWYTAIQKPEHVEVFNCTTGQLNRLTWGQVAGDSTKNFRKNPLEGVSRIPDAAFTSSRIWRNVQLWLNHYLPAWLMDQYLGAIGKRAFLIRLQNRLWKSIQCLEFFTSNQWVFNNHNTLALHERLNHADRKEFNFDVRHLDWDTYMENYCMGTKTYALKEDLTKMPQAKKNIQMLVRRNRIINIIILLIIWRLLMIRFAAARRLWYFLIKETVRLAQKIPGFAKS